MQTFIKHDYDMKIDPLCHEKKLNMLSKGEKKKKKEGRQTTKCYSLLSSLHWVKKTTLRYDMESFYIRIKQIK